MDIVYQYYNEIVLTFKDYETDFKEGTIIIYVPNDAKPFNVVTEKIMRQIERIAGELDPRDKEVVITIQRAEHTKEIRLEAAL